MWTRIAQLFEKADSVSAAGSVVGSVVGSAAGSGAARPVCFAVFLPTNLCNDTIRTSAFGEGQGMAGYHRRSVVIAPSEHGYLRGNQHEIHDGGESGQVSRASTTIALLMNEGAVARWPVTDTAEEALRGAFRVS